MKAIFQGCKAILLDFGGTLDSDGGHWLDRFYTLYQQVGLDIDPAKIKHAFYRADALCCADTQVNPMGLRPLMKHHVRLQFSILKFDNQKKEKEMVASFCAGTEQILKRNVRILEYLRPHYKLGVVSNFYGNVFALCEEAGLVEFLEVILDSTRLGIGKPHPDIFLTALDRLHLPPEQVIFVGDSYERDMIPAQRLGMKTIWMKGPSPRMPQNAKPVDACIASLTELEVLLP